MDGKGSWCDNVFVERLWRNVKYEEIYAESVRVGLSARRASRLPPT
jgi:putative transposase